MDPPVPMPNTSPADNVWLLKVKVTLTPDEDLLVLPSTEDARAVDALVNELNGLIQWRNAYANSPYAKACGDLEITAPATTVPQLLTVRYPKNAPLPPVYGKMAAEWQVDHWQFFKVDLSAPVDGKLRTDFAGPTMIQGSPEANAFLQAERDAIAQAKQQIEAVRGRYADQMARSTRPGTTFRGQISFHQTMLPCELRFLDPPPGGDPRFTAFQITLTSNPSYQFTYHAKLATELPIALPTPTPAPTNSYAIPILDGPSPVPKNNLTFSLVRSSGQEDNRAVPGEMLIGARSMGPDHGLLLLGGHLDGMISYYQSPLILSAQQAQ